MVNLGFEREWYPKYLNLATGQDFTWDSLMRVAQRVTNLVRAFWLREYQGNWSSAMDVPPARWFNEPLRQGPLKGTTLNRAKYDALLQAYYAQRGWDERGVPRKATLEKLGLSGVAQQLYTRFYKETPATV